MTGLASPLPLPASLFSVHCDLGHVLASSLSYCVLIVVLAVAWEVTHQPHFKDEETEAQRP